MKKKHDILHFKQILNKIPDQCKKISESVHYVAQQTNKHDNIFVYLPFALKIFVCTLLCFILIL